MTASWAAPVLALVILGASAAGHVALAVAGQVPDAVQMAVMRYAVGETPLVRVRTDVGTQWGLSPLMDSSGVRIGHRLEGRKLAMRTSVANVQQVEPIPWDQISSLETDRPGTVGKSAFIGGAFGALVGALMAVSTFQLWSPDPDQEHRMNKIFVVSTGGGAALGALMGRRGQRRTIYPSWSAGSR